MNLTLSPLNKINKFQKKSGLVKFFENNDSLRNEVEKYSEENSFRISTLLFESFLKDEEEIRFYNCEGEPSLIIYKKIAKELSSDFFRDYCSGLIQSLQKAPIDNLYVEIPEFKYETFFDEEYYYSTFAEGFLLGNYDFNKYKTEKKAIKKFSINLVAGNKNKITNAVKNASMLINSVIFSRDLINEPAITLTPAEFAKRVKSELSSKTTKVTVFNKQELVKRKMNAILAVGGGSDKEPKLIQMHYKPVGKAKKKIGLVGKGVTYDSGGLSIKPTAGMLEMKADMAGGALVAGVIKAADLLKLPIEIIGVIPAVENMINGLSYKPGDIVTTASGKSIEVKDTDAEGRIILADALEYISKFKPDEIIDFATLTGACAVALGLYASGIFTKNDKISEDIIASGQKTFERVWRLPMWDDYKKLLKSDIADISNLGPRWGGAITAAKFLEFFVDKNIPWAHIDIAGPAIKNDLNSYTKTFDPGYGVRLIIDYLGKY
jgi:leucyl aminopeptidase